MRIGNCRPPIIALLTAAVLATGGPASATPNARSIALDVLRADTTLRRTTERRPTLRDEFPVQGRCTSIAITPDDRRLVVVNRQADSVSILEVRDHAGRDTERLIAEVSVGRDPRFVAIDPDGKRAFVTNSNDGTVSVVNLTAPKPHIVGKPIVVGTEPRCIVLTPSGRIAFVANHTSKDVSVISTRLRKVFNTVQVDGHPMAIAITNDGDRFDFDEQVHISRFFGELIDPARPDGFDDAKQGVVDRVRVFDAAFIGVFLGGGALRVNQATLPPLEDAGFTADRRQFCLNTRQILQDVGDENGDKVVFFNSGPDRDGNGAAALRNEVFCPDPDSVDASSSGAIAKTPQGAYHNLLHALLVRDDRLYVLDVGAAPAPPVIFNNNVQSLLALVKRGRHRFTQNLNAQVAKEPKPSEPAFGSLQRTFLNDSVALEANREGSEFLIVSRGGNYVMRARLDASGGLDIGAPDRVVRFQTGNIPSGVVMNSKATRAYTNNEVSTSVTSIDLTSNEVLSQDISSSKPPAAGSREHRILAGKLLFHTALGVPDAGVFDVDIRDIDPVEFRDKASKDAWSSCSSCHDDGHADGVTWLFPTGPRQTIPLEGTFDKGNLADQRIMNWNVVRGSPATDFDQNSRGVQGGIGHAADVNGEDRRALIFNHGPVTGVSDALDAMHEWIATVRAPVMDDAVDAELGREVFELRCASCHGGAKWTKSQTSPLYVNNPTFNEDPIGLGFFDGVVPVDPNLTVAGPQIVQVAKGNDFLRFVEDVGTLDPNNVLEIRGAGAIANQSTQGFPSLSVNGAFNVPALLGVGLSAPYFHDGSAQTLIEVFARHKLDDGQTIQDALTAKERRDLLVLLNSIDDQTATFVSDTDEFLNLP